MHFKLRQFRAMKLINLIWLLLTWLTPTLNCQAISPETFTFEITKGVTCQISDLNASVGKIQQGVLAPLYQKKIDLLKRKLKHISINNRSSRIKIRQQIKRLMDRRRRFEAQCLEKHLSNKTCASPGLSHNILNYGGLLRDYWLYIPATYKCGKTHALAFVFHGGGADALWQREVSLMEDDADREAVVLVYPEGVRSVNAQGDRYHRTWNAGRCCGYAQEQNVDDVGFVRAMIAELEERLWISSKHIYATGFSNGAQMCYRLACELSDKIAAIAPVGAHDAHERRTDGIFANDPFSLQPGYFDSCHPAQLISILHIHGTADPAAFFDFQQGRLCGKLDPWSCSSVMNYVRGWGRLNSCQGSQDFGPFDAAVSPEQLELFYHRGQASCVRYSSCTSGKEIGLCSIEGAGHTWPGGAELDSSIFGSTSYDIDAGKFILEFFLRH